jgi:hypothetical protein
VLNPLTLDQAALKSELLPLKAEHIDVLYKGLKWRQIKWGPTGMSICGDAPLDLSCLRFVARTTAVENLVQKPKNFSRAAMLKKHQLKSGIFKSSRYADDEADLPVDDAADDDEAASPPPDGPKLKAKAGKSLEDGDEDEDEDEDEDGDDGNEEDDDEKRGRGRPKGRGIKKKVGKKWEDGQSVDQGEDGEDLAGGEKRKRDESVETPDSQTAPSEADPGASVPRPPPSPHPPSRAQPIR